MRLAAGGAMAAGLLKVVMGLLCVALDPGTLAAVNPEGIPRWIPHSAAIALAVFGLASWCQRIDSRLLAAWWALAAGAFSRPAILAAGLEGPWTEILLVPVGLGLLMLAARRDAPVRVRRALYAALAAPVAVALVLSMPPSAADALGYVIILAAALVSVRLATYTRRFASCLI